MANRVQLTGSNIEGVSGAKHGAKQNAKAMQNAGTTNYEFGADVGTTSGVQHTGTNITGVSGAQHGAQQNAKAMQRAGRKG